MDFLSELNKHYLCSEEDKRSLKIGLLGSFKRPHLYRVKEHLCESEKFNAKISTDLSREYPRGSAEDEKAYNFRLGHILIRDSRVLIVHLFHENPDESGINYSVLLEIGLVFSACEYDHSLKKYVLVMYEKGFDEKNIGGMLSGLKNTAVKNWQWHEFDTCDEVLLHSTQFCYNCLMDFHS